MGSIDWGQVGDVVHLKSEQVKMPFIAMVDSLFEQNGKGFVTARWYYRPEDTNDGRRKGIDLANEVFESAFTDANSLSKVLGVVTVKRIPVEGEKQPPKGKR
jgi:hypothetical protein